MPTNIENGIGYFNGLKVGALYGSNYINIDNAGNISFAGTAKISSALKLNGKLNFAGMLSGAESASGLLMGVGTSLLPATTSVANSNFAEFRCQTTATSGDNRLAYLRYDIAGAGAGGECLRAFTKGSAALGTARGAHISLDMAAAGTISGLGVGIDAQIMLAASTTYSAGTWAVVNAEIYTNTSSVFTAPNSFFRAVNNGDNKGTVDDNSVLFDLSGFTSGSDHLWYDNQGSAPANVEEWIKIRTPAGIRYLPVYNAVV
jgi:hypothetical protein